jgi:hypothetical protein
LSFRRISSSHRAADTPAGAEAIASDNADAGTIGATVVVEANVRL